MSVFSYRARNKQGNIATGMVEAISEEMAAETLRNQKLAVISIEEVKKRRQLSLKFFNRVKSKDVVIFSRQLSVMVSATVPIVQSLKILVDQTINPTLKEVIAEMTEEIEGGNKLSSVLSHYPDIFSPFYINMIKSGETAGQLDKTLNYLADQQEKDYDLMSKIKGAMIYPSFILAGLIIVGAIMMIFVIPKLTSVLAESGVALPLSTRILIGTSDFLSGFWWLLVLLLIVIVIGGRFFIKTPTGRHLLDLAKIKMPILGKLSQNIYLVRFTRSLSTLMIGGVSLTSALKIVAEVIDNTIYRDLVLRTMREVDDGNSISIIFLQSKYVPPMISQMMTVGEQTGKLDEVLEKLTDFYSREMENMVRNLTSILEPVVMILMGVAVGILVAAIIMPMYNMAGAM